MKDNCQSSPMADTGGDATTTSPGTDSELVPIRDPGIRSGSE